jgi:VIT1/CCC1 family predicted Fe2+/Mn2+ transporter
MSVIKNDSNKKQRPLHYSSNISFLAAAFGAIFLLLFFVFTSPGAHATALTAHAVPVYGLAGGHPSP